MVRFIPTLALVVLATTALPMTANSEGLGDLFSNSASSQQEKFLPVTQAFSVSALTKAKGTDATLSVQFDITPGHYVYKDKIKLTLPKGVTAAPFTFSQSAQSIDDPQFGRVPVFDQKAVTATTTLTNTSGAAINNAAVTVGWQGCAKAGLCYPPEKVATTVTLGVPAKPAAAAPAKDKPAVDKATPKTAAAAPVAAPKVESVTDNAQAATQPTAATAEQTAATAAASDSANPTQTTEDTLAEETVALDENGNPILAEGEVTDADLLEDGSVDALDDTETPLATPLNATTTGNANAADTPALVDADPFGLGTHPWLALGILFLAGLGLAFTPCVLPMLPIVANIVGNQKDPTPKKAVILTSSYALGVAIAYGLLGALIAIFGQSLNIIGWLQNPIILLSFAAVFVLLALYMLELVPLRLPASISNKLTKFNDAGSSKLGSAGGSLVAGFLSALVVSPCVSAPLFGALLAVSTIGNPLLGFGALFMLGFGLSAPLILLGATQGSFMPKAGMWMNWVKQGFALMLFAVALLLIERVFISALMLLVWALWFMVVAVWAWQWERGGQVLTRALGLMAGVWATVLIIGGALGNTDSLAPLASLNNQSAQSVSSQPIASTNTATPTQRITTLAEVDALVASQPNVLIDVTADWCIECRIMDKNLFAQLPAELSGWQVVKLDITETTAESKAILARYKLFGPPTLLYYQDGTLVGQQVGETQRKDFIDILTKLQR
ncbi:protein-disulfide reductase DsbD domain-containing protein [Psychrobacter arenosus]|uniref:cytochrome c biogenesis protein CcdA n=1 Tax=Psychrobacter arenosus TaxID=256326 RepID=UPI0019198D9F|nr:protein-disulfide reductase DsbD domain-containing protein [Psychrobacter arenosus]